MPRIALFGLPLAATLLLSGCFGWDPFDGNVPTEKEIAEKIHLNPKPQKSWRLVLSVDGAPGPFRHAVASVDYAGVKSPGCSFRTSAWGTSAEPYHRIEVPVTPLPDGRFAIVVNEDALIEEDYFGSGICRWRTVGPMILFGASGADGEASFVFRPSFSDMKDGGEIRRFYRKSDYPFGSRPDDSVIGTSTADNDLPEQSGGLFTIGATVERGFE